MRLLSADNELWKHCDCEAREENNYSTKVSGYYMLGSSSSNSKRDKYINTWIRVQYRFIFLVFLFSELFGTRAYALVQITENKKNSENKSYIAPESMR